MAFILMIYKKTLQFTLNNKRNLPKVSAADGASVFNFFSFAFPKCLYRKVIGRSQLATKHLKNGLRLTGFDALLIDCEVHYHFSNNL